MMKNDCAVCGIDIGRFAPCQCNEPALVGPDQFANKKLPDLVVTRDGKPVEDQAQGIRDFKAACLQAGDKLGVSAAVVREAFQAISLDYSISADERHAFAQVAYYAKAETLNKLRRMLKT